MGYSGHQIILAMRNVDLLIMFSSNETPLLPICGYSDLFDNGSFLSFVRGFTIDLKRQHALEKEEQRKASVSQQNALKKFVDFFNRQQGTPSQFQIPDLYTPQVFSGSISTLGGPSSISPAPSSTPLGRGDCYTLTFDPETSHSGEQDDNDSDDGNREYDVNI
ncbi:hypothetical protein Tco_1127329 [Tanacetum coccineum]